MKYVLKTPAPARARFDLERELNPQQRAVVEAPLGKVLVIAGAGTGKTRTLTYRVARLVQRGCPPERILLCTFTNRAAREMVGRVEALLGLDMQRCWAGTFHHIGNRLLRRFGEPLGLAPDFGILDSEDARTLLGSVIGELGLEKITARRFPQPKLLHALFGLALGTGHPLDRVLREHAPKLVSEAAAIEAVMAKYARRKREMNVCDFDDLLWLWQRLMREPAYAPVADEIRRCFDHVLVDEYQDVSALQGVLCDEMARVSGSLTAVGDDDQSIYAFRGADFRQIALFQERHPDARILRLTINYRSTPEILALANRSIAHNRLQHRKALQSVKHAAMRPAVVPLRDVYQQAEFVAQRLLEVHHEQNVPLSKIAVLYRNHSHSLELQVELERRSIPYGVRSGVRFFEQAHIKDVIAYLRARENPRDTLAWVRLLRQWPGIGTQTAERLAQTLADTAGDLRSPLDTLRREIGRMRGRGRQALERLAYLWEVLGAPEQQNPGDAIRKVVEAHYAEYADRAFTNAATRKEDLEHLADYARRYDAAEAFLSELALAEGMKAETILGADAPDERVVLSTIHQAKGLEWPICFVLSLSEGRFPSAQAIRTPPELEEERRLFYVAVTRAADELYLCYPTVEQGPNGPSRLQRPSRFLTELDHAPVVFDRWEIDEAPLET